MKIRYDKDWNECLTEEELQKMISQISQTKGLRNLKKGGGGDEDEEGIEKEVKDIEKGAVNRKKMRTRIGKEVNVYSVFRDTDVTKVHKSYFIPICYL